MSASVLFMEVQHRRRAEARLTGGKTFYGSGGGIHATHLTQDGTTRLIDEWPDVIGEKIHPGPDTKLASLPLIRPRTWTTLSLR